jgi:hypothetical protein
MKQLNQIQAKKRERILDDPIIMDSSGKNESLSLKA